MKRVFNRDGHIKSHLLVVPAKAGIHKMLTTLVAGIRRHDGQRWFSTFYGFANRAFGLWIGLASIGIILGWTGYGHCAGIFRFADTEKPKPEFSSTPEGIIVKLIPRAKSTSIQIRFNVIAGGQLAEVKGIDFMEIDRPEVDVKNFKSAAFEMRITGVTPGGEAKASLISDFFNSGTAFYVYNPGREKPWIEEAPVQNLEQPERARQLVVTVKDGGALDADGAADGRITLIGGPRDSFWGYALGTLLIRFFGIFIVLTILMVGMLISGFIFKLSGQRQPIQPIAQAPQKTVSAADVPPVAKSASANQPEAGNPPEKITDAEVAVIAAALHLHANQGPAGTDNRSRIQTSTATGPWTTEGRARMMNARLMVYNR